MKFESACRHVINCSHQQQYGFCTHPHVIYHVKNCQRTQTQAAGCDMTAIAVAGPVVSAMR